ncbi:MAG: glycosyltransferase family 2 protein [Desulfovibrionaceae bacterium]|jgi:glycosyltransferase involved in cell wall biosynthesis|nr:glycosyltransferase family 2 protein [Desulfovibrionaceae bacterium]
MNQHPELSVIVAAYNEEAVIADNLSRMAAQLASRPETTWEMILVDDGSADRTHELLQAFAASAPGPVTVLRHRRNFGQGRALRNAFAAAKGSIIVTMDADLSYGPEYIHTLYDALHSSGADIALASAYAPGGKVQNVPAYRHFLSRYGNRYLALMTPYPIHTATCVVRAYRREVIDSCVLTCDGMELQLEILGKAALAEYRVHEVPATLAWRADKAQNASLGRASKMKILRAIRLYLLMGWLWRPGLPLFALSALLLAAAALAATANGTAAAILAVGAITTFVQGLLALQAQHHHDQTQLALRQIAGKADSGLAGEE